MKNKRLIISTIENSLEKLGVFDDVSQEAEAESKSLSYYEYHRKFFAEVMKKIMKKYKNYDGFWGVEEILNQKDMYLLLKRIVISYYFE